MKLALDPSDRPFLPRGVRMITDKVRGGKVLLCPEKAIALDAIGVAILSRVDGSASFEEIVAGLAQDALAEVGGSHQRGGLRDRAAVNAKPVDHLREDRALAPEAGGRGVGDVVGDDLHRAPFML